MDGKFHPTLHSACDYLSKLVLKLIYVSKRGPRFFRLKYNVLVESYIYHYLSGQ